MYEILQENVRLCINDTWYTTTAVLTTARGGKQVHFVHSDGKVLKKLPYSRSAYGHIDHNKDGFGEENDMSQKQPFSLRDKDLFGEEGLLQ